MLVTELTVKNLRCRETDSILQGRGGTGGLPFGAHRGGGGGGHQEGLHLRTPGIVQRKGGGLNRGQGKGGGEG